MMRLALLGLVIAACDVPPSASLDVTLQRLDRTGQCWSNVTTPSDLDTFDLGTICSAPSSKILQGGADRLRFVIVYRDVDFDADSVDPPTLTLRLDGVAQTTAFAVVQQRVSHRLAVLAEFDAPARAASELVLDVVAAPGLETTFPSDSTNHISILPPVLAITAAGCPSNGACILPAGVGATAIDLTLYAHDGGPATLTWTIDGIPQPESRALTLAADGEVVTARDFVPVPIAAHSWQITGHVAGLDAAAPEIQLAPPAISAALTSCAAPCTIAGASVQTVTISAPLGIRDPKASVSTFVNGVPALVDLEVDLVTTDVGAGTVEGVKQLTAPSSPNAAWMIDVRVSGFRAPGIAAAIAP